MTVFKASNAIDVHYRTNERGVSVGSHPNGYDVTPGHDMDVEQTNALREFFQRERDEANGVWRSQIDRTWTAVHEAGHPTVQFRNDDGMREFSIYPDRSNLHAWSPELQEIGREYLDAHPERKPWQEAKPGEVWVLSTSDGHEDAFMVMAVHELGIVFEADQFREPLDSPDITGGRRIWPEDAS